MGTIDFHEFDVGSEGVLFSTTVGAKAMQVSHLFGKFSLSQNCLIIRPRSDSYHLRFGYYAFLVLFRFERLLIPDHMQASFRIEDFYQYRVVQPSLSEQTQIARFLDYETAKIDRLIEKQRQLIELLKEKRQAVISHAVTKGLNPDAPMKDSGVEWLGKVPAHWTTGSVRRITQYHKQGYYSKDEYVDNGTPLLRITDLRDDTTIDFSDCPQLLVREVDIREFGLHEGDFVFVRSGASIGKFGIVDEPTKAIFGSYTIRFSFVDLVIRDFLRWYFQSRTFLDGLFSTLHGGAMKNINAENIKLQIVPIPPEAEQRKIACYLRRLEGKMLKLVLAAEQQITLLQERRTALISAAVTGKIDVRGWTPPEGADVTEAVA